MTLVSRAEFLNSWGKRFVAVIPAYLSSLNISLFLTTLSTSVVSVSVNDLNSTMVGSLHALFVCLGSLHALFVCLVSSARPRARARACVWGGGGGGSL